MWRVEQNMTSSEYSITRGVGNNRGQRKTRVVSPVIDQNGCPGREPDSLNPAGTWVGVSARMYNDLNSLGDGSISFAESRVNRGGNKHCKFTCRQGRGWTQKRLQAQRKFFVREVDSCMTVGASIVVADAGGHGEGVSHNRSEGFNQGWKLIRIKKRTARACKRVGVTPLTTPSGRYIKWDFCYV